MFLIVLGISIIVGGAFVGGFFAYQYLDLGEDSDQNTGGTYQNWGEDLVLSKATAEDFLNFEGIIAKSPMIADLPDEGVLLLSFYNSDSGEWEWENEYTLKKNSVTIGSTDGYDIKLNLNSRYLSVLEEDNLCNVINLAKNNGDFYSESAISTTSLLWKYKGMLDYKSCLGL